MFNKPLQAAVSIEELRQASVFIEQLQKLSAYYPNFRAGGRRTKTGDPQQTLVYAAEGLHSEWKLHRFVCFGELRGFVREVQSSQWYRDRVGNQDIEVAKGNSAQVAAHGGLFYISIPPIHRRKMVVIHELAHAIYWRPGSKAEDHGPSFCAIYLAMVKEFMGSRAESELKALFKTKGVRVAPPSAVKRVRILKQAPWRQVLAAV